MLHNWLVHIRCSSAHHIPDEGVLISLQAQKLTISMYAGASSDPPKMNKMTDKLGTAVAPILSAAILLFVRLYEINSHLVHTDLQAFDLNKTILLWLSMEPVPSLNLGY